MTNLTNDQRARLDKLATYLEGLPDRCYHFDMRNYYDGPRQAEVEYALQNGGFGCRTVACALGHGPAAGILVPEALVYDTVDWNAYASLFVGGFDNLEYYWAFYDDWSYVDNTPRGAAARIRYMLDKGVPEQFNEFYINQNFVNLYTPYRVDFVEDVQ